MNKIIHEKELSFAIAALKAIEIFKVPYFLWPLSEEKKLDPLKVDKFS